MSYKKENIFMALSLLLLGLLPVVPAWSQAHPEFTLNFLPSPNAVSSMANQSCGAGNSGMGMNGMGGLGPGCGGSDGYFLQEIVNNNGVEYFHVIIGDPNVDDFAMEFFIRTSGCCWWEGGRMGRGMGGGSVPFSSSYGETNNRLYNAWQPLEGGAALTGNGTANPTRVYLRQINNDGEMRQDFTKAREANKPHIVQVIDDSELLSMFDLDMSNGGYDAYSDPASFTNRTTIVDVGSFDPNVDAFGDNVAAANVTAGRYTYTADNPAGIAFGGSYGSYTYDEGAFDVYGANWIAFCQPDQNPGRQCNFDTDGRGMGMGRR